MARKGNQQKNGVAQHLPNHKRGGVPVSGIQSTTEDRTVDDRKVDAVNEIPNDSHTTSEKTTNSTFHAQEEKKSKKKSKKSQKKETKVSVETVADQADSGNDNSKAGKTDTKTAESSNIRERSDHNSDQGLKSDDSTTTTSSFGNLPEGVDGLGNVEFPETATIKYIRTAAFSMAKAFAEWVERQTPNFVSFKASTTKVRDNVRVKIQRAKPIVLKWLMHLGNITLLILIAWLDCTLRGIDSFIRMGTTSFFSIVWCSVFSVIAMAGITKFLIILAVAAAVGRFLGFVLGLILIGISGAVLLWFYGSFWTTGFIIFLSGLAFVLSHDRLSLFIMSVYSTYCAWNYVGWLGLVLSFNLSFISSDVLLFFLRNMTSDQRSSNTSPEQAHEGQSFFSHNDSAHPTSSTDAGAASTGAPGPSDRNPGVPSTSGYDSEMTSEDEVVRLLNCSDHYAAFGCARFGAIDVSVIKKEYRKKAMLVHPDKNMGNEKAVEAFKKLQNAYEVLLDSSKRKEYDDELKREELLDYFRKFNNAPHEHHREADREDLIGESRKIACKKCGFLHIWFLTKKLKSRARWCQECKDFHQAKDGDGWVEQSSQPFFFGMMQKVEAPSAYVCADGKVYDATEWYICQGMRCSVNSHKPSFHVNTSIVSRNNHSKGSSGSGQRGGIPTPAEETMTEEEFFEWLQNAMQSGGFERSSSENPTSTRFNPKTSNNDNGSNSSSSSTKRKKKGKKW